MKAISVRQPTVLAILAGYQRVTFRPGSTRLRGDVLLHASSRFGAVERDRLLRLRESGVTLPDPAPEELGTICGLVEIVDCRRSEPLDRAMAAEEPMRSYCLELANPRPLPPVPHPGHLYLFDVEEDLLTRILASA